MKKILTVFILSFCSLLSWATSYSVVSPDGRLKAVVVVEKNNVSYSLFCDEIQVVEPSKIALITDAQGSTFKVASVRRQTINSQIKTLFYKKSSVKDNCNVLTLNGKGKSLTVRMYNDGFAYKWDVKAPVVVENEIAEFAFAENTIGWVTYTENKYIANVDMRANRENQLHTSHENVPFHGSLTDLDDSHLTFLPSLIESQGVKLCILETGLYNYPGMYLRGVKGENTLKGDFPEYPKTLVRGGHNNLQLKVTEREPYIAKFETTEALLPWRIIAVAREDKDLIENDLAFILAPAQDPAIDFSFVKPGKVAWEWWNAWNLYGVDFETGINNQTYKYYIDFASQYGIEYVILDEGWATKNKGDLFDVVPEINLEELVQYGAERNVGIILWAGYYAFDKDMEAVCEHYSKMGVKGFKVDFMDRDDQIMTAFHERAAKTTARWGLMIDFHGTYKPVGLHRTYPNVINYEGVHGLEQMKWRPAKTDQVTYDVTIPFTRLVAGPADYTQGAMRNVIKKNYSPCRGEPMSQGTRCRQLAEYVIFDAPLSMLCDSPSNYMSEPQYTKFLTSIPTVWNEVKALGGKVGEWVCEARRSGETWYVGAMTDWNARSVEINFDFLPQETDYVLTIYKDGANANKVARDYAVEVLPLPQSRRLTLKMAPGGGFIIKIEKK